MTEEEWNTSNDPSGMLRFLFTRKNGRLSPTERKPRHFAVACCRRVVGRISDQAVHRAIETAEQFAETLPSQLGANHCQGQLRLVAASDITAQAVVRAVDCAVNITILPDRLWSGWANPYDSCVVNASWWSVEAVYQEAVYYGAPNPETWKQSRADEELAQTQLLRCIFGNPFRPAVLDPEWRTSTVVQLARGIYDDRDFDRLPILADALQDAGCDNPEVLNHCRQPGPHARGCWVVDLVLGKV
ncbi:MAG: hypothetical protein U0792_05725 [Gemmataceae bacterium]